MASSATKWRRPPRDLKMVYAGMLCGGLTAEHFSRLFFPKAVVHGKPAIHSNCQLRLKLLRQDGLLERIEQYQTPKEGKRPYLYRPTKRGVQAIADWLGCDSQDLSYRQKDSRLSSTYARHLIGENDLRVAILCGVRDTPGVKLPTWLDSVTLKATHGADKMTVRGPHGGTQTAVLIPDGYFELQLSQPYERMFRHFVEIDMGTETGCSPPYMLRAEGGTTLVSISLMVQMWSVKPAAIAGVCRLQRRSSSSTRSASVSTVRAKLYTQSSHAHAASNASTCLE